jgi:pimeloyl-ACP methyl ester carboxylesterase
MKGRGPAQPADGAQTGEVAGVAYERSGSGPPLVLIHGLGATRSVWRPVVGLLAAEREVIAVDVPGFGGSPELAEAPTPWALGAAIARACRELGVERPHVAGNSLGGWVALEMGKEGDAASLCLISPAGLWRRPLGERRFDSQRWGRRLRPVILGLTRIRPAREAMLRTSIGRPELVPAEEGRATIAAWIDAPGYEGANIEMRRHVATDLERIDVPTTIVWGELDRLVGAPRPERRPPDSRFIQLPGIGHTPTWDDPGLIASLLLEASSPAPAAA